MKDAFRSAGVLAVLFLLLHLPFLPKSLEDVDSINFALGIRHYDVAQHQPHPPGYPLYIAAAKLLHVLVPNEATTLALLSVFSGALAVFALVRWFARLDAGALTGRWPLVGTALTVAAPLFWFTAGRPLSDVPGLAATIAIQAMTLTASSAAQIATTAFVAALAAGIRSQLWWLTVPLIALTIARRPVGEWITVAARVAVAFVVGTLVWFVPLVVISGGPQAYFRALSVQGAEDFILQGMLWASRSPRVALIAANSTFIAPWATPYLAVPMLVMAAMGGLVLLLRSRRALVTLIVAFVPYLVFDVLFQEAVTTRYALPVVVPFTYLVIRGVAAMPRAIATAVATVLIAACLWPGLSDVRAYASAPAPGFVMLDDMAAAKTGSGFVLAMHRREDIDFRRSFQWDPDAPTPIERLAAPPKREWMEAVNYWNRGGRLPVWFVADPLRNDLALIDHEPPRVYRWPLKFPVLVGGVRPNVMDWYVMDRPGWYLGRGWSVTPETAGVAREDAQGPAHGPIHGWLRRRGEPVTMAVGGRNLSAAPAHLRVSVDGRAVDEADIAPGFFLRFVTIPEGALAAATTGDYAEMTVEATGDIAIEQFNAQSPGRLMFGYGDGWHELEYQPLTGVVWRWMSEHGTLQVRGTGQPQVLHLAGITENLSKRSHVTVRGGDRKLAEFEIGSSFDIRAPIPGDLIGPDVSRLVVETDQAYVPAEQGASQDRRHLALKVYLCEFVPER